MEVFKEPGNLKHHLHVVVCRSLACAFLKHSSDSWCLLSKIVVSLHSDVLHEVSGGTG